VSCEPTKHGFAFAASDYRVQGWAVKEAIEDTDALRRYFVSKHGTPAQTYISDLTAYELLAALAGTSEQFVARFVDADGHCNFTPGQIGSAFDALLAWAREGRRPLPGEQK
jgi:hypothetical protein